MANIHGGRTDAEALRLLVQIALEYGVGDRCENYRRGEAAVLATIQDTEPRDSIFWTIRRSAHVAREYRMTETTADDTAADAMSRDSLRMILEHVGRLHVDQIHDQAHTLLCHAHFAHIY